MSNLIGIDLFAIEYTTDNIDGVELYTKLIKKAFDDFASAKVQQNQDPKIIHYRDLKLNSSPKYVEYQNMMNERLKYFYFDIYIEAFLEATMQGTSLLTYFQQTFLDLIRGVQGNSIQSAELIEHYHYRLLDDPTRLSLINQIKALQNTLTDLYQEGRYFGQLLDIRVAYYQLIPLYSLFIYYLENINTKKFQRIVPRITLLGTAGLLRNQYCREYFDFFVYRFVFEPFNVPHTIAQNTRENPFENPKPKTVEDMVSREFYPKRYEFYEQKLGFTDEFRAYMKKQYRYPRETPAMFTIWEYRLLKHMMHIWHIERPNGDPSSPNSTRCSLTTKDYMDLVWHVRNTIPRAMEGMLCQSILQKLEACVMRSKLYEEHNPLIRDVYKFIKGYRGDERLRVVSASQVHLMCLLGLQLQLEGIHYSLSDDEKKKYIDSTKLSQPEVDQLVDWMLIRLFAAVYYYPFENMFGLRLAIMVNTFILYRTLRDFFGSNEDIEESLNEDALYLSPDPNNEEEDEEDDEEDEDSESESPPAKPTKPTKPLPTPNENSVSILYIHSMYQIGKLFQMNQFDVFRKTGQAEIRYRIFA